MNTSDGNSQSQVYSIPQNIERGCACSQEKYYKVCIARAAVNESVCEDSHTEHMYFASAAVSTSI